MIKNRITLKQLEAFVSVVDTGTFRAAARALGTTQPNISARIAALEELLDTRLLTRDAGSVHLTAVGERLLTKAREVLWAGEAFLEEADRRELMEDRLRLGVTELVACSWLQNFLRLLKASYPALKVELEVDISTRIEQRLVEGQIDLALQSDPFRINSFHSIPLQQEAYVWVAPSQDAAAFGARAEPAELFTQTIVTHAKNTQAGAALHGLAESGGFDASRIVHSSALSACLPLVAEGMGVGLLPLRLVAADIKAGRLAVVPGSWLPQPLSFFARYAAERAPRFVGCAAQLAVQASALLENHDF